MNTELRKEAKNDLEKDFFKPRNNAVFGKAMENVRKQRDIKLVITNKRRNYLVSEPNYHTKKWFSEHLLATEIKKKTKAKINKPVYLGLSILEFIKTLMHGLYQNNAKLCYVDTDSLVFDIKTEDFYKDIADDVEK